MTPPLPYYELCLSVLLVILAFGAIDVLLSWIADQRTLDRDIRRWKEQNHSPDEPAEACERTVGASNPSGGGVNG